MDAENGAGNNVSPKLLPRARYCLNFLWDASQKRISPPRCRSSSAYSHLIRYYLRIGCAAFLLVPRNPADPRPLIWNLETSTQLERCHCAIHPIHASTLCSAAKKRRIPTLLVNHERFRPRTGQASGVPRSGESLRWNTMDVHAFAEADVDILLRSHVFSSVYGDYTARRLQEESQGQTTILLAEHQPA